MTIFYWGKTNWRIKCEILSLLIKIIDMGLKYIVSTSLQIHSLHIVSSCVHADTLNCLTKLMEDRSSPSPFFPFLEQVSYFPCDHFD